MILTVNKGVSMVVMDRDDYNKKAEALLQQPAYRPITNDPTNKYKTKLIALLKSIKTEGGINESTYKRLYPTWAASCKFYGLPKIHKEGTPLRPIVSTTGAVTYSTSKELSRILKPLVGKSPHHIHNNQDFMEHLKGIKLDPDEVMVSYDVRALFTSVPIQPALEVIEKLLKEDPDLQSRTTMSTKDIMDLLGVLPEEHLFHLERKVLWAGGRSCHGPSLQPNCGKSLHGEFWNESPTVITKPPFSVEEVCWWHLCHHEDGPQGRISDPHKFSGQ